MCVVPLPLFRSKECGPTLLWTYLSVACGAPGLWNERWLLPCSRTCVTQTAPNLYSAGGESWERPACKCRVQVCSENGSLKLWVLAWFLGDLKHLLRAWLVYPCSWIWCPGFVVWLIHSFNSDYWHAYKIFFMLESSVHVVMSVNEDKLN